MKMIILISLFMLNGLLSGSLLAQKHKVRVGFEIQSKDSKSLGVSLYDSVRKIFKNSKEFILDDTSSYKFKILIQTVDDFFYESLTLFSAIYLVETMEPIQFYFDNLFGTISQENIGYVAEEIYRLAKFIVDTIQNGKKL